MTRVHPRVTHGTAAQIVAHDYIYSNYDCVCVTSVANTGSRLPDISAVVNEVAIQCEVKSSFSITSPVVTLNKTVKRGTVSDMDKLVPILSNQQWQSVTESVDHHRLTDITIGFPGDIGTPTSGKLPKCLKVTDRDILERIRLAIEHNLQTRGDNYLIIVCKAPVQTTYIFFTGLGSNVLNAPPIPALSMAKLRTYGTARKDSMRVALKVCFQLPM